MAVHMDDLQALIAALSAIMTVPLVCDCRAQPLCVITQQRKIVVQLAAMNSELLYIFFCFCTCGTTCNVTVMDTSHYSASKDRSKGDDELPRTGFLFVHSPSDTRKLRDGTLEQT